MSVRRVVAITGGTRGIGRAITECFLGHGEAVAVCSRSARETSLPQDIAHWTIDVRQRADQHRFVREVVKRFGTLDVFINCAGASGWRALKDVDEAFAEDMVKTMMLGTLWGCAAASDALTAGGTIVNVSSLAGKRGSANNSVYCATKFAVNGLTQALAKELGPRGIRVNAVCPVYVETAQLRSALSQSASPAHGDNVTAYLTSFAAGQTALGRLPTAQEVAEVVYFLTSPAASAITGQCVNVDCGVLPQ